MKRAGAVAPEHLVFASDRNDWIQVLRAVAAIAVMLFHLVPQTEIGQRSNAVLRASQFGLFGVDVFFVISGYVVATSAQAIVDWRSAGTFLSRRALRIFVGYWLVLSPVLVLLAMGMPPMTSTPSIITSIALVEWRVENNVLPVAWSLTFELWFYACTAIIFATAAAARPRLFAVLGLVSVLVAWHVGWALHDRVRWAADQIPAPFLLSGLGLEFLWGALFALVMRGRSLASTPAWWLWGVGVALCLVGAVGLWHLTLIDYRIAFMRAMSAGVLGLGLVVIALGLRLRRAPSTLVALGDSSYALYLLHPVLFWLSATFAPNAVVRGYPSHVAISLAAACMLSALGWYYFVERKATAEAFKWVLSLRGSKK